MVPIHETIAFCVEHAGNAPSSPRRAIRGIPINTMAAEAPWQVTWFCEGFALGNETDAEPFQVWEQLTFGVAQRSIFDAAIWRSVDGVADFEACFIVPWEA